MNKTLRRILCAALALLLLAGLCGCKDKRPKSDPVYRENIIDYCLITQEMDDTYRVRVVNPYQKTVFEQANSATPPRVEIVSEGEIAIFYDHKGDINRSWAVVCNPESGYVSDVIRGAFMMKGSYAVYRELLTNQHHLFVKDLREGATYIEASTLTDMDESKPNITLKEGKDGKVTATYKTHKGKNTVDVKFPE